MQVCICAGVHMCLSVHGRAQLGKFGSLFFLNVELGDRTQSPNIRLHAEHSYPLSLLDSPLPPFLGASEAEAGRTKCRLG